MLLSPKKCAAITATAAVPGPTTTSAEALIAGGRSDADEQEMMRMIREAHTDMTISVRDDNRLRKN